MTNVPAYQLVAPTDSAHLEGRGFFFLFICFCLIQLFVPNTKLSAQHRAGKQICTFMLIRRKGGENICPTLICKG